MDDTIENVVKELLSKLGVTKQDLNITININEPIHVYGEVDGIEIGDDYIEGDDCEGCCEGCYGCTCDEGGCSCSDEYSDIYEEVDIEEGNTTYRQAWRILSSLVKIKINESEEKSNVLNLIKQIEEVLELD